MGGVFGDREHVMLKGSGGQLHTRFISLGYATVALDRRPCTGGLIMLIVLNTWG